MAKKKPLKKCVVCKAIIPEDKVVCPSCMKRLLREKSKQKELEEDVLMELRIE